MFELIFKERTENRDDRNLVLTIIAIAAVIRFTGIWYGLPAVYNSTEYFIAKNALSLGARQTLEPLHFIYPTFFTYLIALFFGLFFVFGYLTGIFSSATDFAVQFLLMPTGFYLLGRILNAVAVIAAFVIFYRSIRYLLPPRLSFLVTLLMIFSIHIFEFTFWMVPDAFVLLGSIIVFYYVVKNYYRGLSWKEILFASVVCGLTISTKYNAGFLAPAWILSLIMTENISRYCRFRRGVISGAGVLVGFSLGTPYWVIEFSRFLSGFKIISSQAEYSFNIDAGIPYIWELKELIRVEWLLGILMIIVLLAYFYRLNKFLLPFFLVSMATFLYVGSWEKKGWDYLLLLYPAVLISLAWWLREFRDDVKLRKILVSIILISILINIPRILYRNFLHTQRDTRQMATAWIMENIPSGSSLCYDHYHYDLNLVDINRYTEYGEGSSFLSESLKEELEGFSGISRNYHFISPQKKVATPEIKNEELFRKVNSDSFLWQVYTNPHKSLQEIREDSASVLVLNSETVKKYLTNPVPPEENPVRKDFLQRRHFYQQVKETLEPTQQFEPTWKNPGPVISVYRLKGL